MKNTTAKIVLILVLTSFVGFFLEYLVNAIFVDRDYENLVPGLKIPLVVVASLVFIVCVIIAIRIRPMSGIIDKILSDSSVTTAERLRGRKIISGLPVIIIIMNIIGFFIGPIASTLARSAVSGEDFDLMNLVLVTLLSTATGFAAAMFEINALSSMMTKVKNILAITSLENFKGGLNYGKQNILVTLSSLVLTITVMFVTGYGYTRREVERGLSVYEKTPLAAGDTLYRRYLDMLPDSPEQAKEILSDYSYTYYLVPAAVLAGITLILVVINSIMFAVSHTTQLRFLNKKISDINEGRVDLDKKISVIESNEVGELTENINNLMARLNGIFARTRDSARTIANTSMKLKEAMTNARRSFEDIGGAMSSVTDQTGRQNSRIQETRKHVVVLIELIEKIAERLKKQSEYVMTSSSAVEQISSNISSVSETASRAYSFSSSLQEVAGLGGSQITDTIEAMNQIKDSAGQVTGLISSIQKISAQTNMLAMNAAIEAAHAGESGRGFAVVADEVRNLAEESARSTKLITGLIREMNGRINQGVEQAGKAGDAFQFISADIQKSTDLIQAIASAMSEQQAGTAEVLNAVESLISATEDIKRISGSQEENSEAIRSAIDALTASSEEISKAVGNQKESRHTMERIVADLEEIIENNASVVESLRDITGKFTVS